MCIVTFNNISNLHASKREDKKKIAFDGKLIKFLEITAKINSMAIENRKNNIRWILLQFGNKFLGSIAFLLRLKHLVGKGQ